MTAGPYCISLPMKMCHLVHGLLVWKSSTSMTAICVARLLQVTFPKRMIYYSVFCLCSSVQCGERDVPAITEVN